ncbi:hypothetical protein ACTWJ8_39755, partial (plasmid) [Streptomyces sp. SDT5-1]
DAAQVQGDRPVPMYTQVRYHGSLTHMHGLYWVCAVAQEPTGMRGGTRTRYSLGRFGERGMKPKLHDVRPESLTPVPRMLPGVA